MAALSGRIRTWINGAPAIPVDSVKPARSRAMKRRKGAWGIIGKQKGQLDVMITITFPLPASKDEFLRVNHDILDDDAAPFTFEWEEGEERFVARGCDVSQDDADSNQDGDGSRTITIMPDTVVQVA